MAVMIIPWFQGVYLLTEVEQNVAVIETYSSLDGIPLAGQGVSDSSGNCSIL